MRFSGKFINADGKQVSWWFDAVDEAQLREHLKAKGWQIIELVDEKSKNRDLALKADKKLIWLMACHIFGWVLMAVGVLLMILEIAGVAVCLFIGALFVSVSTFCIADEVGRVMLITNPKEAALLKLGTYAPIIAVVMGCLALKEIKDLKAKLSANA